VNLFSFRFVFGDYQSKTADDDNEESSTVSSRKFPFI